MKARAVSKKAKICTSGGSGALVATIEEAHRQRAGRAQKTPEGFSPMVSEEFTY